MSPERALPERVVVTGKTLDDVAEQVRLEHGPRARIVEASRVTSGGIGGLFAKKYVEATVELPPRGRRSSRGDVSGASLDPDSAAAQQVFAPSPAQRVGLAALLADAEEAEDAFAEIDETPPEPAVSTRSPAFAELMDDLAFNGVAPGDAPATPSAAPVEFAAAPYTADAAPADAVAADAAASDALPVDAAVLGVPGAAAAAVPTGRRAAATEPDAPSRAAPLVRRPGSPAVATATPSSVSPSSLAPALLDGPGDLICVLGRREDVVAIAQAMADSGTGPRAAVRVAGTAATGRFVAVGDRRSALEARASGVELDRATIVAVGWDASGASLAAAIAPDQIWIAVDAGRKHADSERWVARVTALVAADGLAVIGLDDTSTPETVEQLGLPIGWSGA
ncbi:hypothetical protein [Frondihabitans cladoniiphilus]|uniref:Uncharacterized protein n=1 Tax=Frondihabitans cladoniiphilus TaxID=715785 RepID=A0ABP8VX33_9MICO